MALGELTGQRWTRRIDLPPLSPAGVRHLAEGTTYSPEELHRLTGGNPFFLIEVLGCPCDEVPVSASDAVLARVARLDEPARPALEIASLDGYRVDARPGLRGDREHRSGRWTSSSRPVCSPPTGRTCGSGTSSRAWRSSPRSRPTGVWPVTGP